MISVPGIGSGLDINSIVSGLVSAEGDAKTLSLANRRSGIEADRLRHRPDRRGEAHA